MAAGDDGRDERAAPPDTIPALGVAGFVRPTLKLKRDHTISGYMSEWDACNRFVPS
jgi:hypothetical protein